VRDVVGTETISPGSSREDRLMVARLGRSPGFRIVLLPAPSRPAACWASGFTRVSSPVTVTGSRRIRTAFPGAHAWRAAQTRMTRWRYQTRRTRSTEAATHPDQVLLTHLGWPVSW